MASAISAFGYSVPLVVVLVFVALVVGLALAVTFWLTIGLSIYRSIKKTRRQRVRGQLQAELLDRTFDHDADWGPWVETLSGVEREVVESLLDEYLRELEGDNVEHLQELGTVLGIPDRSKRRVERGGEYARLEALTWLTLLGRPDLLEDAAFSPRTPRERAAVARLRYEADDFEEPVEGLRILLDGTATQFTVFGQDTLYRIALRDPGALFEITARNYRDWSEPLLIQVLLVSQHLGASITTEDLSWLTAILEHESEVVRAAAVRALGHVGWRGDVRDDFFIDRLVQDPSSRVRGAVYQTFARWGDERAVDTLIETLQTESEPRARLVGTNELATQRDTIRGPVRAGLATCWDWSTEHTAYDRIARGQTRQVGE